MFEINNSVEMFETWDICQLLDHTEDFHHKILILQDTEFQEETFVVVETKFEIRFASEVFEFCDPLEHPKEETQSEIKFSETKDQQDQLQNSLNLYKSLSLLLLADEEEAELHSRVQADTEKIPQSSKHDKIPQSSKNEKIQQSSKNEKIQQSSKNEKIQQSSKNEKIQQSSKNEKIQQSSKNEKIQQSSKNEKIQHSSKSQELLFEFKSVEKMFQSGKLQSLLGLNNSFFQEIQSQTNEGALGDESSIQEIVLQLLRKRFENLNQSGDPKVLLEKIGFEEGIAKSLKEHIDRNPLDLSLWDWIEHFVNETIIAFSQELPGWATNQGHQMTFSTDYENKESVEKTLNPLHFKYLGSKRRQDELLKKLAEERGEKVESLKFWYHATSCQNAENLFRRGIMLSEGKAKANYSHKDGFYLTDSFEDAAEFARKKFSLSYDRIAILVFSYSTKPREENLLESYEQDEFINLLAAKTDATVMKRLKDVIYFFANGAPSNNPTEQEFGLDRHYKQKIQYIIGPYTNFETRGSQRTRDNINIEFSMTQLCLRHQSIKSRFEEALHMTPIVIPVEEQSPHQASSSRSRSRNRYRVPENSKSPCPYKIPTLDRHFCWYSFSSFVQVVSI
jgi:hypothetical protein